MSQNTKLYAALVIACAALALSIHTAASGPGETGPASAACVDPQARNQIEQLRRALLARDAGAARLANAAGAPTSTPPAAAAEGPSQSPSKSSQSAANGPRMYAHFEVPNPAVTVTQKPNGTYDIRTTDPKLKGTTLQVTAVTETGDEDTLIIRVP